MRQGDGSIVPDLNKRDTPKRPKTWTKGTDLFNSKMKLARTVPKVQKLGQIGVSLLFKFYLSNIDFTTPLSITVP